MGRLPDWYAFVRASKYLGGSVPPWEWETSPRFWLEAVLAAEHAEAKAQQQIEERNRRNAPKGRKR